VLLSDVSIKQLLESKRVVIDPYPREEAFGPASIDLTLGGEFLIFNRQYYPTVDKEYKKTALRYQEDFIVDVRDPKSFSDLYKQVKQDTIVLYPGDFILGTTIEFISLPNDVAAILSGRSSLGRLGIQVHATAGFIDPGFEGKITLEISNISPVIVKLYKGMRVAQLHFYDLSTYSSVDYKTKKKTKYAGQDTVKGSELWKDFVEK
jgi:dCTP deaminase